MDWTGTGTGTGKGSQEAGTGTGTGTGTEDWDWDWGGMAGTEGLIIIIMAACLWAHRISLGR